MKVVYPKHIKKGLLAGMSFSVGSINLSIIQLFIVAIGAASAFGVFNAISKTGSKAMGIIVAIPVLGIFLVVAFFQVSELGLLPFATKMVKNNFLDVSKKFQTNYDKYNPITIMIQKTKNKEKKQSIVHKTENNTTDLVHNLDNAGLL